MKLDEIRHAKNVYKNSDKEGMYIDWKGCSFELFNMLINERI